MSPSVQGRIREHLAFLYGAQEGGLVWQRLAALLDDFRRRNPGPAAARPGRPSLDQGDAILITYGDQFREAGVALLETLHVVLAETLQRPVSGVHLLPFFPYSSDDGFAVIDYTRVDPVLGSWADVERLAGDFRLMFDAVLNHVSRQSPWFQAFRAGDPEYKDWFIALEPGAPVTWQNQVVRPRALPLLTPVQTAAGERLVWTTFSADQIDLNYAHPPVLLKMLEILLLYVEKGAALIRLDAIAYLWKRPGTSCLHLNETHRVVKLMRAVLDAVAPWVVLVTETNVPHEENVSYFGQPLPSEGRTDEAQLVYQFPLPPLLAHSLRTGSARTLSGWVAALHPPEGAAFFNFAASHDGIGLLPARGLLAESEIHALVDRTLAHGGRVSLRANPDGSQSVYELNISFFDLLSDPAGEEPRAIQVARLTASQAILLALAGVPGIYVHSLLGSRSWQAGVGETGQNRTINREKLDRARLEEELADPASLRRHVLDAFRRLLRARASDVAFHPFGGQRVLDAGDAVFALLRTAPDGSSRALCLHNVANREVQVWVALPRSEGPGTWRDLLGGEAAAAGEAGLALTLPPYGVRWLRREPPG
ncbi:MAG: sugar phosphorylase [Chloroflexi bacterium]|nr:MAG: sugar phosphorylase [Chloroflexota bacterium]